ncbi:MAG: hypothetical protein GF330_13640 [Candidatus Eisenbacteria bacterium]|nr:hypothetical protein [Candidatus Eisenbacteria bacterium]
MHARRGLLGGVLLGAALLLLIQWTGGCGGRARRTGEGRVANTELILVARGSLHGLLAPTG